MRIGIVCPYAWDIAGGVQSHINDISLYLSKQNHIVSIASPFANLSDISYQDEEFDKLSIRPITAKSVSVPYNGSVARLSFGPVSATRVSNWLKEGNFDILHLHEPIAPSLSLIASTLSHKIPMVATIHALDTHYLATATAYSILKPIFNKMNNVIVVSKYANSMISKFLPKHSNIHIIPNGIYIDKYFKNNNDNDFNPKINLKGYLRIGFIGRATEERKGLNILLRAFDDIIQNYDKKIILYIAGHDSDNDKLYANLDTKTKENIVVLGVLSEEDKVKFLHFIDILIVPNIYGESFGIVLLEAIASGVRIIASALPPFCELLDNGQYGYLFPPGNIDSLKYSILHYTKHKCIKRNIVDIESLYKYDWNNIGEEILNVYNLAIQK